MDALFLIKLGEIQLKEGNRAEFTERLKRNIKRKLAGIPNSLEARDGRFYLTLSEENAGKARFALERTPGVNALARAVRVPKDMDSVREAVIAVAGERMKEGFSTFKVEARRSDKSFPLDSYGIASQMGADVLDRYPGLRVDVHAPQVVISVEIREKAYVYSICERGERGLPVGSGGKGLLLLSGGIDSPVAGYRMLTRGLALEALYFHAYPYTSQEAWQKVRDLAAVLAAHSGGMVMHTVQFTDVQLKIKKDAPEDHATLYLRAAMMMAADLVVRARGLNSIVTGESLGQVASQTAENMRFTESFTDYAVWRPLVGTDKEDTVRAARALGSYDISILPYEDCCVLFSPKHPVLKADYYAEKEAFAALGLGGLVKAAVDAMETIVVPFSFEPPMADRRSP